MLDVPGRGEGDAGRERPGAVSEVREADRDVHRREGGDVMSSYMEQHGLTLVDNGWRILPIVPAHKSPGRYTAGEWRGYSNWTRHCDRATTAVEVEVWHGWPDTGIGIATGNVVGIDIDILDADLAHRVRACAIRHLGETPLQRQGRAPKTLLVYRAAEPFAGIKAHPLEILCRGQQFVAFGVHPVTQQPYRWLEDSPTEAHVDQLPTVTEAQCRAFLEEALLLLPAEARQRPLVVGPVGEQRGDLRGTLPAITAALEWVPNADLQWDDWWRIGMALKGALGDAGWPLFQAWSAQSDKHVPTATWSTWRSMKPHSIGAGTIYDAALNAGWSPEAGLILNGEVEAALEFAGAPLADDLLADDAEQETPTDDQDDDEATPAPTTSAMTAPLASIDELLQVEGVLAEFVEWCGATAYRRQPWLALGAALALVGTLAGRRYRNERDVRTNIYVVGIADSGGGKENARTRVKQLLFAAGLDRYMGGDEVASGKALLSALAVHPARLFQIDEFGQELHGMLSSKAPAHRREIWTSMTKLYTSSSTVFLGTEYADQKERPRIDLHQPHACVHGTTVPGPFWSALQSGSLSDGSLARFLIFLSPNNYPDAQGRVGITLDPPASLVEACQAIALGPHGHNFGDFDTPHGMNAQSQINAYVVPYHDAATRLARELEADQTDALRQAQGTAKTAALARVLETAHRVALIRAISRDPQSPVVMEADLWWAFQLVRYCYEASREEIELNVADNQHEADHKKALRIIRDAGPMGIDRKDFYASTHWAGPERRRKELLMALLEAGSIEIVPRNPNERRPGRPKEAYRLRDSFSSND